MGMMQQLNERIVSRNALISEHARESGTGEGTVSVNAGANDYI